MQRVDTSTFSAHLKMANEWANQILTKYGSIYSKTFLKLSPKKKTPKYVFKTDKSIAI